MKTDVSTSGPSFVPYSKGTSRSSEASCPAHSHQPSPVSFPFKPLRQNVSSLRRRDNSPVSASRIHVSLLNALHLTVARRLLPAPRAVRGLRGVLAVERRSEAQRHMRPVHHHRHLKLGRRIGTRLAGLGLLVRRREGASAEVDTYRSAV